MLTSVPTPQRAHTATARLRPSAEHGLAVQSPDPTRVAVLLNRNARRVSDRIARRVEHIVGSDNLFYSRSLEEAETLSREIVQRGYGTVVSGGGDGTLCRTVNLVQRYIEESNAWRRERFLRFGEQQHLLGYPRFGFMRLGTGNGMSALTGARHPIRDLQTIIDYAPSRTQSIPLIESDGDRFFFAGMGYDAVLLNDYNWLKQRAKSPFLKPFLQGVMGYFTALFARTLPSYTLGTAPEIEARVTNLGKGYYIDPRRGDRVEEIEPGEVLVEGKLTMVGAGTSPFYGFGFKIFPFAGMMPGMMNLRLATIGHFSTVANLPSIWRGTYRNSKVLHDFLVTGVRVELTKPFPFQHSGDAHGVRDGFELNISEIDLELVDLHQPRRLS